MNTSKDIQEPQGNNANRVLVNVLHLNLKRKWFNMIASGEKKEEYREIKPHCWGGFYLSQLI